MTEITPPSHCPDCSGPIIAFTEERSKVTTHWCENVECPGRIADMLTFVADRTLLEIEGLGPEMARILAGIGYVINLADLFEYCYDIASRLRNGVDEDALIAHLNRSGIPGAATIKMVETVERAKTATWDRWIAALGIPMIGLTLGKTLAKELALSSEGMGSLPASLHAVAALSIDGIGFHKKAELARYAIDPLFAQLCERLHDAGVRPTPLVAAAKAEGAPLAGMIFCITGNHNSVGSRPFIIRELEKLGAVSKTGISAKLSHLFVGSDAGKSKLTKAAGLKQLLQVDEDGLSALLTKHGVIVTGDDLNVDWAV